VIGAEYVIGIEIYALLALSVITSGIINIISALLVGSDRASLEAVGRGVAVIATALTGWLLIPTYGPLGAAITTLAGAFSALVVYGLVPSLRKMKKTPEARG
jgi:O-antigen/teichoic acid export membrane protein